MREKTRLGERGSASARAGGSAEERQTRVDLAACYRLAAHYGMTDQIYTHISARVPGPEEHFLLNAYGLLFEEITASSLIKVDLEGNIVDDTGLGINRAGFVIHSAVHAARHDAMCVMHTHTRAGMAVSAQKHGLLPLTQHAMRFWKRIGYHDYEGIALDLDERQRLVRDLGSHKALILRNHGLLTIGASIHEAFELMYYLERSCQSQIDAMAGGAELNIPAPEVCEHTARQFERPGTTSAERNWPALLRLLDRLDSSFRG